MIKMVSFVWHFGDYSNIWAVQFAVPFIMLCEAVVLVLYVFLFVQEINSARWS
jgi:hypothetical protein